MMEDEKFNSAEYATATFADISISGTFYNHDKYATPRGHGFAAEDANHQYDLIRGKNAKLVGADNAKNGADRIVDGQYIQTKFCSSGSKCVSAAFKDKTMKYIDPSGKPMQIEVPSDYYESAVQAMESRIKQGQVPGVSDPKEAENIIRKSPYTYNQAKNIAKAGNIDSIKFDATNGAIISLSSFGISAVLSFAGSIWNGDDINLSLRNAAASGLKVGGLSFASSVLSSQLSKFGLNSALVSSTDAIINILGPKGSAVIVNTLRSGQNIYGAAAMKSASKLLRGNIISIVVTAMILETVDFVNIFQGRISGKQLFKNIANTGVGIAGGTAGWVAGAGMGATIGSVIPVFGTAAGGIVGGLVGALGIGSLTSKVASATIDHFIEDDASQMISIVENRFSIFGTDYLLSKKEAENIISSLQVRLSGSVLKDMYASFDTRKFADDLLLPLIEKEVKKRAKIKTPTNEEMLQGMKDYLEDIESESYVEERVEVSAFIGEFDGELYLTSDFKASTNGKNIEKYLPIGFYSREELNDLYGLVDIKTKDFSIFEDEKKAKIVAFELINEGKATKDNLKIFKPKIQWYKDLEIMDIENIWYVKINYEKHQYSFTHKLERNAVETYIEYKQPYFVINYAQNVFYHFKNEKQAKVKIFELVENFHLEKEDFELVKG
ncbi:MULTISPECIES: glycine zipper family protein [Lactococcus]|uniref:glycine zipper family protein n=1 Tax=Lactococcus TaxID=1357 RepID=UPI00038B9907|nr:MULTISPECIES: glycine zipper family protein [Lactococcus]AXN66122.1 hypothetical protein L3107_1931 [Lactococcus cremoris]EQC83963.1 hypothetical protein LLT1_02535 [Lactococcus cremoris subsp. cremoris TIFN1]OAJ96594.1 hypothetical protein A7U61_11625 [Lactococcus lactis]QTB97933.1 glycine zipper family protein [Lactococcus cremoris]